MTRALSNGELSVSVAGHGAELCSINCNGIEYLWQADPEFWARHSPVLFPIVGAVYDGTYRVEGKEYKMSQHGFARDMDFTLLSESENEIWFRLTDNEETLKKYPFRFILEIGYRIEGRRIHVMWKVENPSDKTICFQIGAHPAFYYKGEEQNGVKGYFSFNKMETPEYILIKEKGCVSVDVRYPAILDSDSALVIDHDTFAKDALIFENGQLTEVTLHDSKKKPYLKMSFDAPVTGLWAPSAESPFVCIEPWYGRCDRAGYTGDYTQKDWIQHLEPGEVFNAGYIVEIL